MDRKTTERVYVGGKDTERVEYGPDSADMEGEGDVHDPGKYRGITLLSQVLKLLEKVTSGKNNGSAGRGEEPQTGCMS